MPQQLADTAEKLPGTALLLPVGLHNMLSIVMDWMERRDYVYRAGSNTAVISVVANAPPGHYRAPATNTAMMAGGTWRPLLQSSNLAPSTPGDEGYLKSEDNGKTYRIRLESERRLTAHVFVERGGTSVVSDKAGNVYIAGGRVHVYDRGGKQLGVLEVPERPGNLAFGGPDKRTLFMGARTSLYSIRTSAPGD